ncbi:MAG: JAB domain-containing protein [bacterium]|nr:JAB domain-containing protein [bacterium]
MITVSEVSLRYKTETCFEEKPKLSSPSEAEQFLRKIWEADTIELHEVFVLVLLNSALRVLGWSRVSQGSKTGTLVDPIAVAQIAILGNCSSVLCCHNHPSGRLEASAADIHLTERLVKALKLFSIGVDDHVILTRDSYMSFREQGLMKER